MGRYKYQMGLWRLSPSDSKRLHKPFLSRTPRSAALIYRWKWLENVDSDSLEQGALIKKCFVFNWCVCVYV